MNIVSKYIPILSPSIYPKYTAENLPIIVRTALVALFAAGATQFALKQGSKLSKLRFTILLPALLIELIDLVAHFALRRKRALLISEWENRINCSFQANLQIIPWVHNQPEIITQFAIHIVEELNNRDFATQTNFYVSRKDFPELPRNLLFLNQTPYVVFNRRKEGDRLIGAGKDKKVRIALNIDNAQQYACCVLKQTLKTNEEEGYEQVKDLPGFIQLIGKVRDIRLDPEGVRTIERDRLIMPLSSQVLIIYIREIDVQIQRLVDQLNIGGLPVQIKSNFESLSALEDQIIDIMRQLLTSMVAFHEKKLVHCDIKPENILVNGELQNVKTTIIDLGGIKEANPLTLDNLELTPPYVSPELAEAIVRKRKFVSDNQSSASWCDYQLGIIEMNKNIAENITDKIDIWALGLVFYALWFGRLPSQLFQKLTEPEPKSIDIYTTIINESPVFETGFKDEVNKSKKCLDQFSLELADLVTKGTSNSNGQQQVDPQIVKLLELRQRRAHKNFHIKVILYNMLRVDPKERVTAQVALDFLNQQIPSPVKTQTDSIL